MVEMITIGILGWFAMVAVAVIGTIRIKLFWRD